MGRRNGAPASPLPQRAGVDAVRLRLPAAGPWPTLRDYLGERYAAIGADRIDAMLRAGEFVGQAGPVDGDLPFTPGAYLWFHRELLPEPAVPFPVRIVHQDEHLVVADKPHFLSTTPRGRHVAETVLARLRRDLGLPRLSPAHRLDRLTAGLVMFVADPRHRGAYQGLFEQRRVHKEYEAIAPFDPALTMPCTVRSHLVKERGELTAREIPGEPNSESRIDLVEHRDGLGRYRLLPLTGRTHQLRVHMAGLGLPILGDPLYPQVEPDRPADDYRRPLQLLAKTLEFTDPVTGCPRRFESHRTLEAWTSYDSWAS